MVSNLRKTGITIVDDMPWGTHFCCFYETTQDLLALLGPYFATGLELGEFCVWVISDPLTEEDALGTLRHTLPDLDQHLAEHSIEIISVNEWYLKGGAFDLHRVIASWDEKLDHALARGYSGLRVSGNTAWLQKKDWQDFREYEKEVDHFIANQRMIVLCTYPLTACRAADILEVAQLHQVALARRSGKWESVETSALKQAKQAMQRLNAELEQRVIERTSELAATNAALQRKIIECQQAEERLRLIINTIPAMVFTALPDGTVDFVNQRWLDYMGLSLEDVQGWNWDVPIHPEDRARSIDHWRSTMAAGQSAENELRVRRADGVYRWILGRFVPLRDEMGNIVKWYGVSTDIDDRKRAEALLHTREQEFRAIVENAPDHIIRYDRHFRRTYANPAVAQTYGLPAEAVIDKPIGSVIQDAGLVVKADELAQVRH
jgi:PAS domain S-box-containing protein